MFATLQRYSPQLLSLMRIAAAITFIEHGTEKLFDFPVPRPGLSLPLLYFTGILETVGGTLIAAGLFTRIMAFLISGELAVGYWWLHAPRSPFPMLNGGEAMVLESLEYFQPIMVRPGQLEAYLSVYFDAGQVWDRISSMRFLDQKRAVGIGLLLRPLGSAPLGFYLSHAIDPGPLDETERFQFSLAGFF